MSHVDDGTLHAHLDGELSAAEAHGVEAHLTQCPACRARLEEERALIARADELLGLAAPPDHAVPPFRPGDREPPVRLWWHVRLPLAWAASVVLALGIGTYLGRGSSAPPAQRHAEATTDLAARSAPHAPAAPEPVVPEGTAKVRDAHPHRTTAAAAKPLAAPVREPARAQEQAAPLADALPDTRAPGFARDAEAAGAAIEKKAAAPAPSPVSGVVRLEGGGYVMPGPSLTLDSARALLGTDPFAVPGLPVRAIYRGRLIGYSALVVVQQTLDSSRAIEVITGRPAPSRLAAVVVSGAARADTTSPAQRALLGRQAPPDTVTPAPSQGNVARPPERRALDRPAGHLFLEVRGPVSTDSLAALQRRLQPLRP